MKRKERRRLKEDELVSTLNVVIHFIRNRKRELAAAGMAVLFIIVIFAAVRIVKAQSGKKEAYKLTQILKVYSELENSPEGLKKLEDLAGNGRYSRLAYTLLASYWMERGEYDRAIASLEKFSKSKKDFIYYQAQDMLAQIYFRQKNYDKVIDIYKSIEEEKPKDYALDIVLFRLAEAYEMKGEFEKALDLYKKVQKDYPQTFFGMETYQKISKLEEKR